MRQYCGFLESDSLWEWLKWVISSMNSFSENISSQKKIRQKSYLTSLSEKKKCWMIENLHTESALNLLTCFQCEKRYVQYIEIIWHFQTVHLNDYWCILCDLTLLYEMNLWKHTAVVHSISTWFYSICWYQSLVLFLLPVLHLYRECRLKLFLDL